MLNIQISSLQKGLPMTMVNNSWFANPWSCNFYKNM